MRFFSSFRSIYEREVHEGIARTIPGPPITEAELGKLPPAVAQYLRRTGVVGRPRVRNFRARFDGEMRTKPSADWMPIRAEQHNFSEPRARLFLIHASKYGLPFEALHIYSGSDATMRVRVASLIDVVDARGPQMNQSETVTLFNDMCWLAPAMLLEADVAWEELDARNVRATFSNAGQTIRAVLSFDEAGDLVNFVSEDRYRSADGTTYQKLPWSTPVHGHRDFGDARLAEHGEAIWREPGGESAYARFRLIEIEYNVGLSAREDIHETFAADSSAVRARV